MNRLPVDEAVILTMAFLRLRKLLALVSKVDKWKLMHRESSIRWTI